MKKKWVIGTTNLAQFPIAPSPPSARAAVLPSSSLTPHLIPSDCFPTRHKYPQTFSPSADYKQALSTRLLTSQTPALSPHYSQTSFHSRFKHSTITAVSTDIPSMGQNSLSLSTFCVARGRTVLCPSFRSQAAVSWFFLLLWPLFRFVLPSKSCTV